MLEATRQMISVSPREQMESLGLGARIDEIRSHQRKEVAI